MKSLIIAEVLLSIMSLLRCWVMGTFSPINPAVLINIGEFADSQRSSVNHLLAGQLVVETNSKVCQFLHLVFQQSCSLKQIEEASDVPRPLTPANISWSNITARDIAGALTALQGTFFKRIRPADLLIYVYGITLPNRIQAAKEIHEKIVYWIKKTILFHGDFRARGQMLRQFVEAAAVRFNLTRLSHMTSIH
jgi:hypothetical protein